MVGIQSPGYRDSRDSPSNCGALFSLGQVEQMRAELLQERAIKQDLECDKISLERQVRLVLD